MEEPVSTLVHVPGNLRRPACGDNSGSWPLPILWRMGLVKPGRKKMCVTKWRVCVCEIAVHGSLCVQVCVCERDVCDVCVRVCVRARVCDKVAYGKELC